MKKALEAALVVAVLAAATTVVYQWRARRAAAAAAFAENGPATHPGTDVDPAHPDGAPPRVRPSDRGVDSMPMIKMSSPPKSMRRKGPVPPAPGK